MSSYFRHWKLGRNKTSSSSSPSSSLLEQGNNNNNTNTTENKQIHQTTSPRKDAVEEEEVDKIVTTMINDNSKPPLVEEKPQEQKLQPQMEIPNTNTKTISTLEYDVQPKQLLDDNNSCQPLSSHLAQEQPIMTNVSTNNYSLAISPSTSQINDKFLLSPLKGKSQSKEASAELKFGSKQQQTLHSSRINRVSSSQKSITISNNNDVAPTTRANNNNDNNNNAMVPTLPPRDTVNNARRVSSLSLDLNEDGICAADSNATSLSDIINLVEESAMTKPLSMFEETDNAAAQSISTSTSTTTTTTTTTNNNINSNNFDDIAVALSSPLSSSTKTNNGTNSLSTSPYTKMKTVAEFSNNNNRSNISASFITTNTNTCTKVVAATIDSNNLEKSSPPNAVQLKNKTKTSSIGCTNNTCSTDSLEPDSATTTSTKDENKNNGMVILNSTGRTSMTGKEKKILGKKLTGQESSIIRTRRPQSENVEGDYSKYVSIPTSESNDNNFLLRQLKRLCSFNVPGGSEANGGSLPERTKKAPQRLRQDNVNFRSEVNKNIKHKPVAHSTTTTTTTTSSPSTSKSSHKRRIEKKTPIVPSTTITTTTGSPSTSKLSRKRRIEKHMPAAAAPPPTMRHTMRHTTSTTTTTTTNCTPSTAKSSGIGRVEKPSQEAKCTATTILPGRRRCMRCISNGAPTSQAIECPGGKGRSGKGACKFFPQKDTCIVAPHSIVGRRRCMLCIDNGAPTSQAIECPGGKGRSGKGACKFFLQKDTCIVAPHSIAGRRRCMLCIDNGAPTSQAIECPGGKGRSGKGACKFFLQEVKCVVALVSVAYQHKNGTVRKEFKNKINYRKSESKTNEGKPILASPSLGPTKHKTKPGKGRWTIEEHTRFLKAFHLFGTDWTKVAAMVKTRAVSKVQSYAHNSAFGHTLSNWSLNDYEQFLKKVPESWNLANNDHIIKKLRSKERTKDDLSTHASASCSISTSSSPHATSSEEGVKESTTNTTLSREAFHETIQDTAAQLAEIIVESKQETTPRFKFDFSPVKNINTSKTPIEMIGIKGKSSESIGNAPSCENGNSTRSTSKSATKMTTEVNGTEGKSSDSTGNAPNCKSGNSTRSTSKPITKMTTEVNGPEGEPSESVGNAPSFENGNSTRSTSKSATKMTTDTTTEVNGIEGKSTTSIGNAPNCENGNSTRSTSKSATKMTTEVNGTEGKPSESVRNAPSCENGNSTRSTSKSATKMTTEVTIKVNGSEGKPSESIGNAPSCENGNSTRSTSKSITKMTTDVTTEVNGIEGKPSEPVGNAPSFENGNSTRSIPQSATKMTTDMTTEVHGTKSKPSEPVGNASSCESGSSTRSQICTATNNNEKDVVGDSNISIHSSIKNNAKVVKECQMCKGRREGRRRKIAHDAFCRHSKLYTGPDKIVRGKRKKSVVSSSRSSTKSSTVIDTEALTRPTKNESGDSKYLYAVRELASFNEPPENEKHGTEIEVTAGGRIHPKRRRITCNFYEPRLMPDNKFRIMQEEQFGKEDDTEDNDDDGEDDIHNDPNSRTRKYTAMKSTKPKTECKACLFGPSYKMGHCVSCPRSRYYDPTATPASNYTEHQKNKKRGRAEVQLRATTTTTTTGSCDDNFDSGNTTDPTSNKRKKKRKNKYDNDNMSISKKRKKSSSSKASSSSSSRRRNNNNFTVSQDTTRRIITNALIRFQFQDRNHKIRKDHP